MNIIINDAFLVFKLDYVNYVAELINTMYLWKMIMPFTL